jgi:hypothetical protein
MSCQCLLTVVLSFGLMSSLVSAPAWAEKTAPGSAVQDDEVSSSPSPSQTLPQDDSLRSQVRLAMRQPLKTLATAPYTEARALVKLYVQLQSDESLPSGERERFQNLVRTRLAQARGAIVRGLRRRQMEAERTARRQESEDETSVRGLKPALREGGSAKKSMAEGETLSAPQNRLEGQAAGGNPQSEGQDLIELIESTIAPASWETRGGPGVIKYWADGHALVIRQTREVHEQIGGVAGALRP